MDRAKEFYEGKLGLSGGEETPDGGIDIPAVAAPKSTCTPRRGTPVVLGRRKLAGLSVMSKRWWMS